MTPVTCLLLESLTSTQRPSPRALHVPFDKQGMYYKTPDSQVRELGG